MLNRTNQISLVTILAFHKGKFHFRVKIYSGNFIGLGPGSATYCFRAYNISDTVALLPLFVRSV